MPPVTRKDIDLHTGHDICPPTLLITGSPDTFVNSHSVGRRGDDYIPHAHTGSTPIIGQGKSGSGSGSGNGNGTMDIVPMITPPETEDGHELHTPIIATGSPDTFVNSRPVARVSDIVNCGCVVATGSPDTFVNG